MDILSYIQRMNQIYGNGPAPAPRYNTQQYLQGGRVGYRTGKKVVGSQYVKAKPFNKKQQAAIKKQFPNADFSINRYGFVKKNPDGTISKNYNNAVDFAKRGFVSHKIKRLPKNIQSEIQKTFGSSYKGDLNFKTHKFGLPVRNNELLYDRIRSFVDTLQGSERKGPNRGFLKFGFAELEGDNYLLNQFERNKNLLKDKSPYVRIFKDGKVIGFQDNTTKGKGNKYYHVNYQGKGLSIDSHPDFEKVNKYVKIAKNAKVDVGPTLNNLFFKSGYQIPTLNQLLQDLVRKKGVTTTANAIEKAHVKGVTYDTAELQLLTRDKNIKTKVILNDLEKNKISLKEADKLAKKDGIRIYTKGQYIGADVISPEKQVGDVKKFVERKVLQEVAETGSVDALAERIKLKKSVKELTKEQKNRVIEVAQKSRNALVKGDLGMLGEGFSKFAKKMPKTAGALGKTGRFLFGGVEAGLIPLAVAAEGLYANYADKRDLKKALDQMDIPQEQKDALLEGFRQESRDLGGVGLETYAIEQPNVQEKLEEIGYGDRTELLKDARAPIADIREQDARAKQLKQQEIEKRTKEAYEDAIGRRTID